MGEVALRTVARWSRGEELKSIDFEQVRRTEASRRPWSRWAI